MVYRFVVDGGSFMLPILAASVIAVALILERVFYWLRLAASRDAGLRKRLLDGEAPPPAATVSDPIARALVDAVKRPDDLSVAVARAERTMRESRAFLGLIRVAGGSAALLGLLGTTVQLREGFRLAAGGMTAQGFEMYVARTVANALHPTILGLVVFVVAYLAAALFAGLAARLASELDEHLDEVVRRRTPIIRAPEPAPANVAAVVS